MRISNAETSSHRMSVEWQGERSACGCARGGDCRFFSASGWRNLKSFGMQLPGEIFDGGNDARRGAIDGIADYGEAAVAHGVEAAPAGALGERIEIVRGGFGMGRGEDQKIRLQANDFFEAHLRPVLRRSRRWRLAPAFRSASAMKVCFADGDERIGPNNEENAAWRNGVELGLQSGEPALEIVAKGVACFGDAEDVGKLFGRGDDSVDGVGIGGVEGMPRVSSARTVSRRLKLLVTRTRSGCSAAICSRLGLMAPPTLVFSERRRDNRKNPCRPRGDPASRGRKSFP